MTKELFVTSTPHETKVGLVEDDQLAEIYLERENEYTLAGSIYKGRVTRVLPGMQSAFVDIGLERDAFLYVSDFMDLEEQDDDLNEVVPTNRAPLPESRVPQESRPQAHRSETATPAAGETTSYVIESEPFEEESSSRATTTRHAKCLPVSGEAFAAAVAVVAAASRMIAPTAIARRIAPRAPMPPSRNRRCPRCRASFARVPPSTGRLPAINP